MLHLLLHLAVPAAVAAVLYRPRARFAFAVMLSTMLVDVDHLLANPIYDPARCSLGFHPLHAWPLIGIYGLLVAAPAVWRPRPPQAQAARLLHLIGVGLSIHMALDGIDCLTM